VTLTTSTRGAARTLTESLRRSTPDAVVTLLRLRPDLRHPVPQDLTELTAQAVTSRSVARALDGLNAWQRQVAEALAALPDPAAVAAVASLLDVPEESCRTALENLRVRALLWGPDDAVHLVRAVREQFGPYPGALAPPSPRPLPEEQVAELLADLDPVAAEVLQRLAWSPTGALPGADRVVRSDAARGPVEQLLALRLLTPLDGETVILPREVAWHVRGGRFCADPVEPEPPAVGGRSRPVELTDRAAVGAAYGLVHDLDELAEALIARPHRLLRDGGLGQRDVSALARDLHVDAAYAGFLLECGVTTVVASAPDGRLLPTREFDRWRRQPAAERWRRVARGWLDAERLFSRALQPDAHPLGPEGDLPYAASMRHAWLDRLAAAGPGLVPVPEELERAVRWVRPRLARVPLRLDQGLTWLRQEAAWLGLTGMGATSTLTTWLAGADAPLPPEVAGLFPAPVDSIILQADLTAVAAGPLPHGLAAELRLLATQESRGGGGVYRFSSSSLRRAFDAGWSAQQIRDWLDQHSATPVPQPLRYLVDDVARQHGSVRVGRATTYLNVEDPARLAELLAEPQAVQLGLRQVGPGVLIALAEPDDVIAFVDRLGHHPAADRSPFDRTETETALRAPAPKRSGPGLASPEEVAAALLAAGTDATDAAAVEEPATVTENLHRLHAAVRAGRPIMLRYVTDDGSETERRLSPLDLAAGRLRAVDLVTGRIISIPLARIVFAPAAGAADLD
jgi:hypothetical protein